MKVVFVAPHPDDIELFAGGTAVKHSRSGDETVEILLTFGELGGFFRRRGLAERREREAREGASILGMGKLRFLGIGDRKIGLDERASEKIKEAIEAENPELIYAPEPEFSFYKHPDHLAAGRIVKELFSEISTRFYHTKRPNLEIDIRDAYEQKMRATSAHRSQRFVILLWRFIRPWLHHQGIKKVERFRQI